MIRIATSDHFPGILLVSSNLRQTLSFKFEVPLPRRDMPFPFRKPIYAEHSGNLPSECCQLMAKGKAWRLYLFIREISGQSGQELDLTPQPTINNDLLGLRCARGVADFKKVFFRQLDDTARFHVITMSFPLIQCNRKRLYVVCVLSATNDAIRIRIGSARVGRLYYIQLYCTQNDDTTWASNE